DLLKVGVGQNHLPAIGIMWVTAYGIFEIVEKALGKAFDQRIEELELNFNNFWTTFLMVLPFILTIAVLITMIRTMLRYYDLRFLKTSEGFKVIGGLFNRREQSAKMDKIQLVNWSRNPISRLFHLFDLGLKQASSNQVSMKQSIYVPGCYIDQVNQVLQAYYPEQEGRHFTEFQVDKALIVRQVFYLGIVPAAIVTALRVMAAGSIGFLFLLWIPLTYFSARYYHQKWKFEIGRDALRLQRGFFGTKSSLLKWYKVQNVRIKQSPYQQRKGLASVVFFTAGGAIQIPYIDLALAHQIHDYALYQVESSDLPWM
ncbi:MAG: PH domain-containing protein, partial [Bacteroidota bacterium]